MLLRVCAWCGVEIGGGGEAPAQEQTITHGICDPCRNRLVEESGIPLDRFLRSLGLPVLLVSGNVRVTDTSQAALNFLGKSRTEVLGKLGGDVFECVHAELPEGCGRTVHCSGCVIRGSVTHTHDTGAPVHRRPATLKVGSSGVPEEVELFVSTEKVGEHVLLRVERK